MERVLQSAASRSGRTSTETLSAKGSRRATHSYGLTTKTRPFSDCEGHNAPRGTEVVFMAAVRALCTGGLTNGYRDFVKKSGEFWTGLQILAPRDVFGIVARVIMALGTADVGSQ